MEKREILIANNRDQSKYRILTDATTLGELQDAIGRNQEVYRMVDGAWISNATPMDISGLTFTEGITKTQLLSRESALPTNVSFKGQVTNNLVMLLTNTSKQIRSGAGMDRKEAYRLVKELGLQKAIQEGEDQNYTRVPTSVLETYINVALSGATDKQGEPKEGQVGSPVDTHTASDAPHAALVEWFYDGIKQMRLRNILASEDVTVLADLLTELHSRCEEGKASISISDMEDMLEDIL